MKASETVDFHHEQHVNIEMTCEKTCLGIETQFRLKNIVQNGSFPQIEVKMTNI